MSVAHARIESTSFVGDLWWEGELGLVGGADVLFHLAASAREASNAERREPRSLGLQNKLRVSLGDCRVCLRIASTITKIRNYLSISTCCGY